MENEKIIINKALSEQVLEHERRLQTLERSTIQMTSEIKHLNANLKDLQEVVVALNHTLVEVQLKPARSMEHYNDVIVASIIGMIISFIFGKLL